jgi:LacI family transcriptional regulator/LacI family repressor for deo operon, udp, cdd, tsx, nupC, and nupG
VTSIADPFLGDVVKGVEEVARAAGFSLFFSASHNDPEQEMAIIETFRRRRVDGILTTSSRITNAYKKRLSHIRIPTVLINSQDQLQEGVVHWVCIDDLAGAQLAVEHLLHLGHRTIGYLNSSSRPKSAKLRLQGYQNALRLAGVPYRDDWIVAAPGDEASHEEDVVAGQTLLPRLLDAGVTAVFCYNDMIAIGALAACQERGIAVPQELSIVGFDDIQMASYVTPPLTTVSQPRVQLGQMAMQLMLDLLEDRPGRNHLVAPTLILRASTAPCVDK